MAPSVGGDDAYASGGANHGQPQMIVTPPPPTAEQMAKMKAYMPKIKEFQKEKGEDWGEDVEEDLAKNLVAVDELMESTKEERDIESELRKPSKVKGMDVELSLRKRDAEKDGRKKNEKAAAAAKAKEMSEKKKRKDDIQAEDKKMKRMIAAFGRMSQTKAEVEALDAARTDFNRAQNQVAKLKDTQHMKEFQKEYQTETPAEDDPEYPQNKRELGETKAEAKDDRIVKQVISTRMYCESHESESADLSPDMGAKKQLDAKLSSEALKELADLKKTLSSAGVH